MNGFLTRVLGDSPLRVAIRLFVLSLITGFVMSFMGWTAYDVIDGISAFISGVWNLGFDALAYSLDYLILGAAIVVPIFILWRILAFGSASKPPHE